MHKITIDDGETVTVHEGRIEVVSTVFSAVLTESFCANRLKQNDGGSLHIEFNFISREVKT